VARIQASAEDRFKAAELIIRQARDDVKMRMREGFILDPDE